MINFYQDVFNRRSHIFATLNYLAVEIVKQKSEKEEEEEEDRQISDVESAF